MLPQRRHELVMPGRLRPFSPFGQLSAEQLIVAAGRATLKRFRAGDPVLARGTEDPHDYFLLDGRVVMTDVDGNSRMLTSGSPDAGAALASARPCLYDVRALGPVVCARVARGDVAKLRELTKRVRAIGIEDVDERATLPDLLASLRADIAADRVRLPSLPEVAVRVRAAVASAGCDNRRVAELLATDPALAAKILRIANSPLCRGITHVGDLHAAVGRIGLHTVSELVVCFSLKDLFRSDVPVLRACFADVVDVAVQTGAMASTLAGRVAPRLADEAMTAGLLSNIGALPVLEQLGAAGDALTPETTARALAELAPAIGALLCREWAFGVDLSEAVAHADDWSYAAGGDPALTEIVVCARYHTLLGLGRNRDLPRPETVPALRLLGEERSAQTSIDLIRQARDRVDALHSALH